MSKKIMGILLTAILAILLSTSLGYYVSSQPNPTQNNPSPTSTPTPTSTPSPTPTPTPSEKQTGPTPKPVMSVPEFTLKVVQQSFDVAPVTTINQFTGETVVVQNGYHVENNSIVITIKNKPFTPYITSDGNANSLYYKVRVKGQFTEKWTELWHIGPSDSEFTTKYFLYGRWASEQVLMQVSSGCKVDFQVQAVIGHFTVEHYPDAPYLYGWYEVFTGETSSWSNTQTLTIP